MDPGMQICKDEETGGPKQENSDSNNSFHYPDTSKTRL